MLKRVVGLWHEARFIEKLSRLEVCESLQEAFRTNDFRLESQPIVGLRAPQGEALAHEIFIRMRNAAGELIAADKFLAAAERYEEALVEYQLSSELNPTDTEVDQALRDTRQKLRTKVAVTRGGKTELESLIERSRDLAPARRPPSVSRTNAVA